MSTRARDIWEVLGTAPTTDRREVKKAYAKAVKHCHPEEDPEAFQVLYNAYQTALEICAAKDTTRPAAASVQRGQAALKPGSERALIQERSTDFETEQRGLKPENHAGSSGSTNSDSAPSKDADGGADRDADRLDARYESLFAENSRKQQEVLRYWESLWMAYLAHPDQYNSAVLMQFMYDSSFSTIRDLDSVPAKTAAYLTDAMDEIPRDFVYVLWDVFDYRSYDASTDQTPYDSGYQKLYRILKRECETDVDLSLFGRHGAIAKTGRRIYTAVLFGLIAAVSFGLLFGFMSQTAQVARERDRYPNRMAACDQVIDDISEKYPEFMISGGGYPPNDTQREYDIEVTATLKGELRETGSVQITIVEDGKGNLISCSDNFEERSIKLLVKKFGLHCQVALEDSSGESSLMIELAEDTAVEKELEGIYELLDTGTVKNLSLSRVTICGADMPDNVTVMFSDIPDRDALLEKIRAQSGS